MSKKHASKTLAGLVLLLAAAAPAAAQTFTSGGSQTFHIGDTATTSLFRRLTCAGTFINTTGHVRIIISGNCQWNTVQPTLTVVGSGTVSPTVFFDDNLGTNKIMRIVVTANFLAGDTLTITGAQFTNFTGASAAFQLGWDYGGDSVADVFDQNFITIRGNPTAFSSPTQTFNVNDPPQANSTISITEHGSVPGLSALRDLRVRIPAGLAITWDTGDFSPTFGGTGSYHVTGVSYDGGEGNKVMRVLIASDFLAGETLTISNLTFQGFTSANAGAFLTLEINNTTNVPARTDPNAKIIRNVPLLTSFSNQQFTVGDPVTTINTIRVQDASGVPLITSVNDIRIVIPAGLNMTWDPTSEGLVSFAGAGAGNVLVANPVDFENGNKTLVINIDPGLPFTANEQLDISNLRFAINGEVFGGGEIAGSSGFLTLEVDGDGNIEATDSFSKAIGAVNMSSGANQSFAVGAGPFLMSPITIVDDATTPRIKRTNDLRVRIPAGFNMTWDTSDTTATIVFNTGSGSINSTVTFEDANKTLVLDVNGVADFTAGTSVTISNLSYANTSASTISRLELEVNNLNTVADYDTRTIVVGGFATLLSTGNQVFAVNDPSTLAFNMDVTDAPVVATITTGNDIRLRIPSGSNLTWDTTVLAVNDFGHAKTNTTLLPYEDSGRTAVIEVTGNFVISEVVTLAGLRFANFSAPLAATPLLELVVTGPGGIPSDVDDNSIAIGAPTIVSASNQVFGTGDAVTAGASFTVTEDGTTATIRQNRDIRVTIPAALNLAWNTGDNTITVGGSAAAKVGTFLLPYEDGGRTMVIDVTDPAGFLATDTLIVSGTTFNTPAATQSGPGSLGLNVTSDSGDLATGLYSDTDSATIHVSNRPAISSLVTLDSNGNGSIDRVLLNFTEALDDTTSSATLGSGFTVTGFNVTLADQAPAGTLTLFFPETGLPNTGALPGVSYDPLAAGSSLLDLLGLEMVSVSSLVPADGAPPVIVSVARIDSDGNGFIDQLVFTYSETLLAGQEDINDWTIIDADGVTDLLAGLTNANLAISGNTLTFTLLDNSGTTGLPRYRYEEDGSGGEIQDGNGNSASDQTNNIAPQARAGGDFTYPPSVVTLNGNSSFDPDGQPLSYSWTVLGGPVVVTLVNPNTSAPSFTGIVAGVYDFQLDVTDGLASASDTVSIEIANLAPNAHAGPDRVIAAGPIVTLDATRSFDVNGDGLTYLWSQASGPAVTLTAPGTALPTFNSAGVNGVLVFAVLVTDSAGNPATDTVTIRINTANGVPTADAGPDIVVSHGTAVSLDGRLSSDPNDAIVGYDWQPDVLLTGATTATPSLIALAPGQYTFQLIVEDASGVFSRPDTIDVLISPPGNAPPVAIAELEMPAVEVVVGDEVLILGTSSYDPEGQPLNFGWIQESGPRIILYNPLGSINTFNPVVAGTYRFKLLVDDGFQQGVPAYLDIHVKASSGALLPDAVPQISAADDPDTDGRVSSLTNPTDLTGVNSTPGGLAFVWEQERGPAVPLAAHTTVTPNFAATLAGTYVFKLTVEDGDGLTDQESVTVVVDTPANEAPTAAAGANGTGTAASSAALSGVGSSDPGSDADGVTNFGNGLLAYWSQVSGPTATIADPYDPTTTFLPPVAGTYVFSLTVSDGTAASAPDLVSMVIAAAPVADDDDDDRCGLLGIEALVLMGLVSLVRRRIR